MLRDGDTLRDFIVRASRSGVSTGHDRHPVERAYRDRCSHFHWHTGTCILFTRDTGHHTSGWFKNPAYERCWHLSLSFRAPMPEVEPGRMANMHKLAIFMRARGQFMPNVPFDHAQARFWVQAIFTPEQQRHIWEEGPFSGEGKHLGVRHYRVFCNPLWEPWATHGEVYSREATEVGWRSWSEVQGEDAPPNWVSAE